MFYVDYPSDIRDGTVIQAILASVVSAELQKLQDLTGFSITLDTSVTPATPGVASPTQQANAVQLQITSFSVNQVTALILVQIMPNSKQLTYYNDFLAN